MKATHYKFDPRPTEPLQFTAVCYQPANPPPDGVTLILAHAAGTHKETWEPLLGYMFAMQEKSSSGPQILEAWSMENPNHGESAVINDLDIQQKLPNFASDGFFPRLILAFMNSNPGGVDFASRNLIALGHSSGGNALLLLQSLTSKYNFRHLILLDPTLGRKSKAKDHMQRVLTQIAWNKKDTWPSREAALEYFKKQPGFRNWDTDVLLLFVKHGLRDHPASKLPDPWCFKGGVTLACSRANEAASYLADEHNTFAFNYLHQLYREQKPVYLLHSKADEFNGGDLKLEQTKPDPVSGLGPIKVQIIEGGGHMFVQTNPKRTAEAVWNALSDIYPKSQTEQPIAYGVPKAKL